MIVDFGHGSDANFTTLANLNGMKNTSNTECYRGWTDGKRVSLTPSILVLLNHKRRIMHRKKGIRPSTIFIARSCKIRYFSEQSVRTVSNAR